MTISRLELHFESVHTLGLRKGECSGSERVRVKKRDSAEIPLTFKVLVGRDTPCDPAAP